VICAEPLACGTSFALTTPFRPKAKLAAEKENRQKRKLIAASRQGDCGTVRAACGAWLEQMGADKQAKASALRAEIDDEQVRKQ
jgi:hypothetical protein